MMRDDDDGDEEEEGGGSTREDDLNRLMRSLNEDMTTTTLQSNHTHGFGLTSPLPPQQHFHEFSTLPPAGSSFSQSHPTSELLSMPSPSVTWNSDSPHFQSNNSNLTNSINQGYSPPLREATSLDWDSLPKFSPWHQGKYTDSIQELLSTTLTPWNYETSGSIPPPPTTGPLEKGSHVTHSRPASPRSSIGGPARMNSTAPITLPSTPNSSLSSESFSDVEDHFHYGSSSNARPPLQPLPSSSAKRKTPEQAFDECYNEIQSLDSNILSYKARRKGPKRLREPRYAIQARSDVEVMEDGYKWRKYGQKAVKNSPHPRSYYRCTNPKCPVRKRLERSADDTGLVITTYEGTHTHVIPSTAGSRAGASSDAPFLPATGEYPPGGAPYQPPPKPSEPPVAPPLREPATTSIHDVSKPLRPTPSICTIEPMTFLSIPPRVPLSGTLLLHAQQQNNRIKTLSNPLQDAMCNSIETLSNPLQDAMCSSIETLSDPLIQDLQDAMCNSIETLSDPLIQDLQDAMCLGTSVIRASPQQELRNSYSKPPPPPSSSSSSRGELLEDIVRHRR